VALASFIGCADDDDGGTDAGAGGDAGGIENTGGRASGGTGGRASGGTGGAPPSAGGAESGGSGPATGGAGATGGASTEAGDGTGGGTALPDSGTDGNGPDAGDGGGAPQGPLCPITTSFPAGTYTLRGLIATYIADQVSGPLQGESCSLERAEKTLTISPSSADPSRFDIVLEEHGFLVYPFEYPALEAVESGESVRLVMACPEMECPGTAGRASFSVEINKRTGAVTAFEFAWDKNAHQDQEATFRATGWPRCAATEAAPPTWIPDVTPWWSPNNHCSLRSAPPVGCFVRMEWSSDPLGPYPNCSTSGFSCDAVLTCEDIERSFIATCCPP
jgi:hypothetical protein